MLAVAEYSYVVVASISFLTFRALHYYIRANISLPSRLPANKEWPYRRTLVSFIYACISSIWIVYNFHDKPEILSDMMNDWSQPSYYLLAFAIGYYMDDSLYIMINDFKGSTGLIIHHIVTFVVIVFVLSTERYITIATSLVSLELNSIFFHLRRLMRFNEVRPSTLAYKMNLAGMFVTFVALRFVLLVWLSVYFAHKGRTVPLSHYLLAIFGFFVLIVMSVIIFLRLFKTEFTMFNKRNRNHTD